MVERTVAVLRSSTEALIISPRPAEAKLVAMTINIMFKKLINLCRRPTIQYAIPRKRSG
jgi:hypothetical protein